MKKKNLDVPTPLGVQIYLLPYQCTYHHHRHRHHSLDLGLDDMQKQCIQKPNGKMKIEMEKHNSEDIFKS